MPFVSFAQNFEDVMLWRALNGVEQGFYVDVGAWSATSDSVTRAFYERGWRGINIEPNPPYYSELIRHRPRDVNLQQAVSDVIGQVEMYLVPDSGLSLLDEAVARDAESLKSSVIAVQLTTLATIWASHVPAGQDVHFLKVDVEGAEEAVLRGNDWARNRPWIVIVKATKPSSRVDSYHLWEPLLTLANYTFAYADGLNRFYVAAEQKRLAEALRYPPNVFDGLIRLREYEAETRAAAADKAREQLAAQAAEEVTAHARVLARARDNIDALQNKVTALSEKLAGAESVIDYVTQRKLLEKMFFRYDGRPVEPLRRMLFHTSGEPKRVFRRLVLHKDATPRNAFARWVQNQNNVPRLGTQHTARLTAEPDALGGDTNRIQAVVRDLQAPLAGPPRRASPRFARRMERRVLRPILHGLRSLLTGGRVDRPPRSEQGEGPPSLPASPHSSPPGLQHDVLSEMRQLAAEMEKALLTLAMERGPDAWPATPTSSGPTSAFVRGGREVEEGASPPSGDHLKGS